MTAEDERQFDHDGWQRLDKWLWFARVVKSRTLATRLVEAGHVRVNGQRGMVAARPVSPGDVLTIALEREVRVLRIVATGKRRGPFKDARLLFENVGPGSLGDTGLALPA